MRTDDLKTRTIYVKFDIGDIVYLKLREDKYKGILGGFDVRPTGNTYFVAWEDGSNSYHYDMELTSEFIPTYNSTHAEED